MSGFQLPGAEPHLVLGPALHPGDRLVLHTLAHHLHPHVLRVPDKDAAGHRSRPRGLPVPSAPEQHAHVQRDLPSLLLLDIRCDHQVAPMRHNDSDQLLADPEAMQSQETQTSAAQLHSVREHAECVESGTKSRSNDEDAGSCFVIVRSDRVSARYFRPSERNQGQVLLHEVLSALRRDHGHSRPAQRLHQFHTVLLHEPHVSNDVRSVV